MFKDSALLVMLLNSFLENFIISITSPVDLDLNTTLTFLLKITATKNAIRRLSRLETRWGQPPKILSLWTKPCLLLWQICLYRLVPKYR